jgi:hypothetical protein
MADDSRRPPANLASGAQKVLPERSAYGVEIVGINDRCGARGRRGLFVEQLIRPGHRR